jgi:uncharacterized protein YkwD
MKKRMRGALMATCLAAMLAVSVMPVSAMASGGEVRLSTEINGQSVELFFPAGSEAAIAYNRDVKPLLPNGNGRMSDAAIAAMEAWKNKYASGSQTPPQAPAPQQPANNPPSTVSWQLTQEQLTEYAAEAFKLANEARELAGLAPLARDSDLESAAVIRAEELSRNFSHTRPDGTRFFTVMGVERNYNSGENGGARTSPEAQVQSWLNSEGHRSNILDSHRGYTKMGIGVYQDSNGNLYWCQLFYRPTPRK